MKRFLIPLLAALALPTAVNAGVDPEVRKACLPAADFEGCVRSYTKSTKKVKVREFDFLGQPVIPNWYMAETIEDNKVTYYNFWEIKKVKVRGGFNRYIGYDAVVRWYQEPQAGTSGYSTTIGSSYTNCSGVDTTYGSSIGCTTTPGATINIPGTSAVPGGVRQQKYLVVIDCLEETYKMYPSGRNKKWQSITKKGIGTIAAQENCHRISSLPTASITKLAKGKANKKDIEARNTLSTNTWSRKMAGYSWSAVNNESLLHLSKEKRLKLPFEEWEVTKVFNKTPASKAGLLKGDRILKINNTSVKGLSNEEVYKLTLVDKLVLTIKRDGKTKKIPITKEIITKFKLRIYEDS